MARGGAPKGQGQQAQKMPVYPKYSKDADVFVAHSQHVSDPHENYISEEQVRKQLAQAPRPRTITKSGYPHKFNNVADQFPELIPPSRPNSTDSTTSHFEYPIFASGSAWDYDTKKKHKEGNSGNLRAITNQNGRFKGVYAHNGEDNKAYKGPLHRAEKQKGPP